MILDKTNQNPLGRRATCAILHWRSVNSMLGLRVHGRSNHFLFVLSHLNYRTGGLHRNRCTILAYLGEFVICCAKKLEQGKSQNICEMGCGYRDLVCNSDCCSTDTDRLRREVAFLSFCWIDHNLGKSCISPSKCLTYVHIFCIFCQLAFFANDGLRSKRSKPTSIMWSRATWQT